MKEITMVGIDLAKESFQIHAVDKHGRALLRKKILRKDLLSFVAHLQPCVIAMEACGGAHYWGRKFREFGHEVRLMAAQYVKPFVKSQKNDRNDAEAIVEAASRPSMRFVAVKEVWQQDLQSLHRARQQLVEIRTKLVNQTRGLLAEHGVTVPKGLCKFRASIKGIAAEEPLELTEILSSIIRVNTQHLREVDVSIEAIEKKLENLASENESCQRLMDIPGVGLHIATQFVSAVGNPHLFKNGRQAAAWVGLVPRQNSTGGKERLLGITKRGDRNLRAILIHGARSVIRSSIEKKKTDPLSQWVLKLYEEKGWNKTAVALANRTVRVMWHLLAHKEEYVLKMAV